jgi:X-X-X-Leu-X-X-Gly heptad repeat protein
MKTIRIGAVLSVLLLSGCASMYEGMGIASKESVAAQAAKLQTLQDQVSDLSTKVGQLSDTSQRVAQVEALLKTMSGRVDKLPQETLKKLADLLTKAAAEAGTAPSAP